MRCFSSPRSLRDPMYSDHDDQVSLVGFPHSDIPGSKLVYQLPEAFRRYPRPSSPVSAKASTVCPSLLDHISLSIRSSSARHRAPLVFPFLNCQRTTAYSIRPSGPWAVVNSDTRPSTLLTSPLHFSPLPLSFPLLPFPSATLPPQPPSSLPPSGGADRDRTGDPLLAKQVLSHLSYSPFWWAQVDSNH